MQATHQQKATDLSLNKVEELTSLNEESMLHHTGLGKTRGQNYAKHSGSDTLNADTGKIPSPSHHFGNIGLHTPMPLQAKLQVNEPGDKYEQEADEVADKVMRTTGPVDSPAAITPVNIIQQKCNTCGKEEVKEEEKEQEEKDDKNKDGLQRKMIWRKCADCEKEDEAKKNLQRKESGNTTPAVPATVYQTLQSTGQPLDNTTRSFMEHRFGFDFAKVQVHNDALAHQSAKQINALAYTHQNNIVFGEGQYRPQTEAGKKLLAHELTHVIQQRGTAEPAVMKWSFKKANNVIEENILEKDKLTEVFINDFDLPGEKGDVKDVYDSYIANKQLFSQVDLNNANNKRTFLDKRSETDLLVRKWKDRVKWDAIAVDKLTPADKSLYFTIKASLDKKEIKDGDKTYQSWENNIDHIVELQLGGSDGEKNLQILAKEPNQKSGRDINLAVGDIATAYKEEHKNETRTGKQLKISVVSTVVKGSFPLINGFQFPLEPKVEKFERDLTKIDGNEYNFIAGANSAKAIFKDEELKNPKGSEIQENNITNKSFTRFIPLIKLNKIKGKNADQLEGEFNPQEGRLPIQVTKSQKLAFNVDSTRNVKSSATQKPTAIDFYYPYLSKGKITELKIENGEVSGKGKIYPSVKFIKELDIEFSKDEFKIVNKIDIKSPINSIRVTQSDISLSLFPKLIAQGTIGLEAGNKDKPIMKAILVAGADENGFFATGDADFFIPNVDKAQGKISYRKVNDVYSLEASVDAKMTSKEKKFLKEGDIHVTYKDGEITASGTMGLDIPNTKNTTIGVDYKKGNWILKGKTTVTIPRLNDVTFDIVYDLDKDKLKGTGSTDFKFKTFKGNIKLTYNDGKISGEGTLDVTKGKVKGSAKIKLNEKGKFSGEGSVTIELMKDVEGTAGIIIDEEEKVTVKGQIKVLKPYSIFPKKEFNKNLFEKAFTIPIPGVSVGPVGLVLEIKTGADFNAGIGPGTLNDILINASFNPFEDDKNPTFSFYTKFNINAYAKLSLYIQAALAIDALIAAVKGGIRLTGIAQLNANLNVPLTVKYENNVFSIDSEINALAALILGLNIEGIVEAEVAKGYIGHWEKRWMLKQFTYAPPGAKIGMNLPIKYASDKPFVMPGIDDIKITQPEIDAKSMLSDTMSKSGDEKEL